MRQPLVFIVDDDESVRDAFILALTDEPYEVRSFDGGQAAVDAAVNDRPDLVFLDLKMPGIDGVQTLRLLMGHDPSLRVYIVTAFAEEFMEGLREARRSGLVFQLASKPITDEQIRMIATATLG